MAFDYSWRLDCRHPNMSLQVGVHGVTVMAAETSIVEEVRSSSGGGRVVD
jgi:hypothetical protein